MSTYRKIVSDIRSMNKLFSSDGMLNDRDILAEVKTAANMIVLQAFKKRQYFQSPNLFSFIPCLELEQIPLAECCDYVGNKKVAITKKSIPKVGEGSFGSAIQGVFGIDNSKQFKETNPVRYSNLLKLDLKNNDFYWLRSDGRIVVTDEDVTRINVYAYFTELIPNSLLIPDSSCKCNYKKLDVESLCSNPLDQRFPFVDGREFDLKQLVYKNLLSTYFSINNDPQSNNKDEQGRQ